MEKKCLLITKYMIQDTLDTGTTFLIQFEMCPLFQPPWTPVEDAAVNFVMLCLGTSSVHYFVYIYTYIHMEFLL
jgi:hypothetical protein